MNRTCIASAILLCIASATQADSLALDDRSGVFSGTTRGGSAAMAYQDFWLEPLGSECLHDLENYLDYEAVFSPAIFGVGITPQMLDGFTLNTNGTLRLALGIDSWAEGSVTVGAPPLLWGELYGWASIHRCSGGVQEMCYACGRRHSSDDGYDCSHDLGCAARTSYANGCTCSPLLVRVNWDDDNWNFSEDRLDTNPCAGDDETEGFRAIGVGRYCCCHGDISGTTSVSELTASSELRLWNGSTAASSSASAFAIEAISASSGIGSATVSYELRDETNGFLRTVTRQATAANLGIRPDFNDDETVDNYDRFYFDDGGTWQLRVRDEPYKFALVSECPSAASASLLAVQSAGTGTVIRTQATGGTTLPFGTPSTSPLFAAKNETKELFVDTSNGPGTIYLHYSLGFGGAHAPLADTRQIHIADANVREQWATTNSLADLVYNFSDVLGDVYWTIYDDEDNIVDYGDGSSFTPIDLPPGNYTVEVYFADVYEDGILGYTSSAPLHVVTIEHSLLWETANRTNRIFNPTPKDDETAPERQETEGEYRYAAPRNYLYVVEDASAGTFNATEKVTVIPSNSTQKVFCAAFRDGDFVAIGSTNINELGEAALQIPAPTEAVAATYEVRAGIDLNNDGILSYTESIPLEVYTYQGQTRNATIKGISGAKYTQHQQAIDWVHETGENPPEFILPMARSFLSIFYKNGDNYLHQNLKPNDVETLTLNPFVMGNAYSEWLTHNCGAEFDAADAATITKYIWWSTSDMSKYMAERTPLAPWIQHTTTHIEYDNTNPGVPIITTETYHLRTATGDALWGYYETNLQHLAQAALINKNDGETWCYPSDNEWLTSEEIGVLISESPTSWVERATITLGDKGCYGGLMSAISSLVSSAVTGGPELLEYDTYNAIGRGRVKDAKYRYIVTKRTHLLSSPTYAVSIAFNCRIQDLYDFNYEDGSPAKDAAALQIGVVGAANHDQTRRNCGRIYCHEIQIEKVYTSPYDN